MKKQFLMNSFEDKEMRVGSCFLEVELESLVLPCQGLAGLQDEETA